MHVIVLLNQLPNGRHLFNHLAVEAVHSFGAINRHRGDVILVCFIVDRFKHDAAHPISCLDFTRKSGSEKAPDLLLTDLH